MSEAAVRAPSLAESPARPAAALGARLAPVWIVLALMPAAYGLVAFHGQWAKMLKGPILAHVAFEWAANAIVVLSCLSLSGRFDQRLGQAFVRTLTVHGVLAFLTLITRHYYSIPMMVLGVSASAALGATTTALAGGARRQRAGVLGPWPTEDTGLALARIEAPDAPLPACDLILVTFPDAPPAEWTPVLTRALLAGRRVRHLGDVLEEARGAVEISGFGLDHLRETGPWPYDTGKRLLDLAAVALLAPLAAPVALLAAAAVRLTMGAPVLFAQQRVGQGGKPFTIWKLRTMRAEPVAAGIATGADDARITPLGRWLRRFRIDELPQLVNVLAGEMSLVGPRPEQVGLAAAYADASPAFAWRALVRPGITGWAQVRAPYAADLAETRVKLAYDLFYVKHQSFALDIQILARTAWTVITGAGAR